MIASAKKAHYNRLDELSDVFAHLYSLYSWIAIKKKKKN